MEDLKRGDGSSPPMTIRKRIQEGCRSAGSGEESSAPPRKRPRTQKSTTQSESEGVNGSDSGSKGPVASTGRIVGGFLPRNLKMRGSANRQRELQARRARQRASMRPTRPVAAPRDIHGESDARGAGARTSRWGAKTAATSRATVESKAPSQTIETPADQASTPVVASGGGGDNTPVVSTPQGSPARAPTAQERRRRRPQEDRIAREPVRHIPAYMGARSVECYKRLNTIDAGTYGVVHRAKDKETGQVVALKKIKMENSNGGFPVTSLREINILLAIDHPNIIKLKEIVIDGRDYRSIYLVMEYLDHDLKALMSQMKKMNKNFRQSEVKTLMRQLLSAVSAMHKGWILHRDLKTSNLLYSNGGVLKVCDFGLARKYSEPIGNYTPLVVTLHYRAPELLLGAKRYTEAIDMWSVGCIFAEMLTRKPLLPGKSEVEQIKKIFSLLGSPSEEEWPGYKDLPHVKNFMWPKNQRSRLREKFPRQTFSDSFYLDDVGFDLLSRLLAYNPAKRISAEEALRHQWFSTAPLPQPLSFMPTFPSVNEKKRR